MYCVRLPASTHAESNRPGNFDLQNGRPYTERKTSTDVNNDITKKVPSKEGSISTTSTREAHLPAISITYSSDEIRHEQQTPRPAHDGSPLRRNKRPCVYVCCLCNHRHISAGEDNLRRHVLHALQHEFYVRTGPCGDVQPEWLDGVRDADACVFVLNDSSIKSMACFKGLHTALAFDVPTVFVKDSNYSLPNPLPENVLRYNLGLIPMEPWLSPSSVQSETFPGRDNANAGEYGDTKKTSALPHSMLPAESRGAHGPAKRRAQVSHGRLQDSNVFVHLLNGYRDAHVFSDTLRENCETALKKRLHTLLRARKRDGDGGGTASAPASQRPMPTLPRQSGSPTVQMQQRSFLTVPGIQLDLRASLKKGSTDDRRVLEDKTASNSFLSVPGHLFPSRTDLAQIPCAQSDGKGLALSRPNSPPVWNELLNNAASAEVEATAKGSSPLSGKASASRSTTVTPSTLLEQIQQQLLQTDPNSCLRVPSPPTTTSLPKNVVKARHTTSTYFMIKKCRRSKIRQTKTVKWEESKSNKTSSIPSPGSPVSLDEDFKGLSLSTEVVETRRSDTPNSDASATVL